MRSSFRLRLTIWNAAVLAAVLAVFGLTLSFTLRAWIFQAVDQELADRVRRMPFGPGGPRPPGGPQPGEMGRPGRNGPGHPGFEGRGFGDEDFGRHGPGDHGFGGQAPGIAGQDGQRFEPGPFGVHGGPGPDGGGGGPRPRAQAPPAADVSSAMWPYATEAARRAALWQPRFVDPDGTIQGPPEFRTLWVARDVPAAMHGQDVYSTIEKDGERLRVLTSPAPMPGGRGVGAIQVARELGDFDRIWKGQLALLEGLIPVALLAAVGVGFFLTNRALRPVQDVTEAAEQIGAADLSRRLEVRGSDELAQLAATFNRMIARIESAFEKQRQFTADASHELRTPLSRIKVSTSLALASASSIEDYRTALSIADRSADHMQRLVDQLLTLARADSGALSSAHTTVDLVDLVTDVAGEYTGLPAIELQLPGHRVQAEGDPEQLARVLSNLVENALRHTPASGKVFIGLEEWDGEPRVVVRDNGMGIAPEHLPHLTERFYRVDRSRSRESGGAGLGLAICKSIVEAHGGRLEIESVLGRGTTVTVTLRAPVQGTDWAGPKRVASGRESPALTGEPR